MRTTVRTLCAGSILALAGCGADESRVRTLTVEEAELAPQDAARLRANAENAANRLGATLKARLMTAMRDGGPEAAINVCAEEAPIIAQSVSSETGTTIGRTALRVRNTDNAADPWARSVLMSWSDEVNAEPAAALSYVDTVQVQADGARSYRWARAIRLEPQCTLCHGTDISAEINTLIAGRYPDDAATGFSPGDLRGAFIAEIPIDGD